MANAGYTACSGLVALSAAVAKTNLFVVAGSQHGINLKKFRVSMDGTTIGAPSVLVELTQLTGASNVTPGTNNTTITPVQAYGREVSVSSWAAGAACTLEPTVQTVYDAWDQTPYQSAIFYDWPLGDTPDMPVNQGFAVRLTAQQSVNARITMWFERI